jgi:flagellar biosynthesis protein FlhA
VAPSLRSALARFARASLPGLHVLAWNEIPDNRRIRLIAAVGR